ncbi:putative T7SS-secreted protein [Microbacterium sp. 22179]|uniref:putative T7SS-secreted protein n=1 Tax=Microbacterium sp. 22179 TaxID=3453886 RepID=UPI003F879468
MTVVTSFSRVEDLVPGDLGSIVSARDMLGAGITPSQAVATTLSGVRVQGWKGVGADQFAQVSLREPERVAALPAAFSRASSAMSVWESAFGAARAAAAEAIQLAARADALTTQSQAEHRKAIVAAQSTSAAAAVQAPPLFVDRGAALNAQAQTTLASALGTLNAVAADVAAAIRPTAGWPPSDPEDRNGWDKVLFFAPDLIWGGIFGGIAEIVVGTAETAWWVFETFDPFRFIVDQINGGQQWSDAWWENFTRRFGEIGDTIAYVIANPGETIGAVLGEFFAVDLWADQPGAAFGRVVFNLALLGSGIGGVLRGVRAATTIAKAAGKVRALKALATKLFDGSPTVKIDNGRVVINGKPLMSVSEWADGYEASTHNMDADRVTLGKWIESSPDSYEEIAAAIGDRYFNMPSSSTNDMWKDLVSKYGLTDEEMFELYNKPFLKEAIEDNVPINFTVDPRAGTGKFLTWEYRFLQSNGYEYNPSTMMMTPPEG